MGGRCRRGKPIKGKIYITQRGGRRPNAGRKPGSKTKARKVEIVSLADKAKVHADVALATLAEICQKGSTESARVAAANALLDRGYGRVRQSIELGGRLEHEHQHSVGESVSDTLKWIDEALGEGEAAAMPH